MNQKLDPGALFPKLSLSLLGGESMDLPGDLSNPMTLTLFYRGHWWPYCRRLLAGYEARREAFAEQGVGLIAGSVDDQERTAEVAAYVGFPMEFKNTKDDGDAIGSWGEEKRQIIQPSEFLRTKRGRVIISVYSNGPVGRMDPNETLTLVRYLNQQRAQANGS